MSLDFRSITDEERSAYFEAVARGFGSDPETAPESAERFWAMMPLDRTVAAFDGDRIVGTLGDFALTLSVPGGVQVPMAGTTEVTVRATHRRRGILREMMQRHLSMAAERGEPIAGLWASESAIYGRFGFGLAAELHEVRFDSRLIEFPGVADDLTIDLVESNDLLDEVAPYWSAVAPHRAGFLDRSPERWRHIMFDPPEWRDGATRSRHVVVRRGDAIVAYAAYRQKRRWENSVPLGTVVVQAAVSSDLAARRALWHHLTHVDLFPIVEFWDAPVDDSIMSEASEPRHIRRVVTDALHLRILDPVAALSARRYECDGTIVLGITDDLSYASGAHRLTVDGGVGVVEPTEATPDVMLDVRDLGALYLGRNAAGLLHATGAITGEVGAIRRCSRLFATLQAPWCPEMF